MQGDAAFWKFHDIMFKNQAALDTASLEKYAKEVGADLDKFKKCMESKKFADLIQKDLDYGEKIGVRSTPTFFINGQLLTGAVPVEQFAEIIDAENEEPAGRTLDFLSQEMLREANTIASKCLDAVISREIVEIKGDIDRIKEQAQNVE